MSDLIPNNKIASVKPGYMDLVRNEAARVSKEAMDSREARRASLPPKIPVRVESTFAASPHTSTNQFESPKGRRRSGATEDAGLRKPFAFALGKWKDGATIYFGQLLSTVSILRYKRIKVAGEWVNSLAAQDAIKGVTATLPDNLDTTDSKLKPTKLDWFGDVYLYWEADSATGEISLCDIRGPSQPSGSDIKELDDELSRGSGSDGEGAYYVKIGAVDEDDGVTDQLISSDVTWSITLVPEGDSSSGDSSGSSSGDSSGSSSGGSGGGSESEKSSNAIVEGPWTEGKFVALATLESNQVLFEFIVRDIRLRGPVTKVKIDPRFLYVCEPDSLCVAASPCGDGPYAVGASVKGEILTLTGLVRADRRPKVVNVRLTGTRKGFKDWDMPSRSAKQKQQSEEARRREYDR